MMNSKIISISYMIIIFLVTNNMVFAQEDKPTISIDGFSVTELHNYIPTLFLLIVVSTLIVIFYWRKRNK